MCAFRSADDSLFWDWGVFGGHIEWPSLGTSNAREEGYEKSIDFEMEWVRRQQEGRTLRENLHETSLVYKHEKGADCTERTRLEVIRRGRTTGRNSNDEDGESRTEE
jgi:hypothetical protein